LITENETIDHKEKTPMPDNNVPTVEIKRNGGVPQIQLKFGFAQFASFRVLLWDTQGHNPSEIAKDTNLPGRPDTFAIGNSAADLNDRYITWQATIASATGNPNQQFSQTAGFVQDGVNCPEGPFNQTGSFSNTIATFANARFKMVD
jgi:hypothetical protein